MNNKTMDIINAFSQDKEVTYENILYVLKHIEQEEEEYLFVTAYHIRNKIYGKSVFVRGLIEFSNFCTSMCNYCGLRCESPIERYRLMPKIITQQCIKAYDFGYRTFVLQSGEDPWYTKTIMMEMIQEIKDNCPEAALTLSIGERTMDEYAAFRAAGVDRYLLRHEAINSTLYKSLHPNMRYDNRMRCLYTLKTLNYQTGAGIMVGVKGQTIAHIAEDLLFLYKFKPHMVGIGPFLPAQNTPYTTQPPGNVDLTLFVLALVRILVPHTLLPLTTALVSLNPNIREKGFRAGANVIMPNITPENQGAKYILYDNKRYVDGLSSFKMRQLSEEIEKIGFHMDMCRGDCRSSW
ncbi:MAG: [FeFe] hydrogenase H-cluster radical SAM maturase HydE [Eubacteriales bacterium]